MNRARLDMPGRSSPMTEFDAVFVPHTAFTEVLKDIEDIFSVHGQLREAPNVFVTGPAGAGKTTMIELFLAAHPRVENGRRVSAPGGDAVCDDVPLLVSEMPSQPTVNSLARQLLKDLGHAFWNKGDRDALKNNLVGFAQDCGVKGVVIDEAQRAVDRDGEVRSEDIAEFLKELQGLLNVSFFLFGMGRVRGLFDHDDQVDRRWEEELAIPPYQWGADNADPEPESRLNFIAVLASMREQSPLPFANEIDVEMNDCAKQFYYASRGVVGLLKKLLLAAMRIAARDGDSVISSDLLYRAFEKAFRKEKKHERLINPWGQEWMGQAPPPLRDHSLPIRRKKPTKPNATKAERRNEIIAALSKR